jgi:hypothetical protein
VARPRTQQPTVTYRHNVARGRHELGVKVNGSFVPFATLDDARVAQLVENEGSTVDTDNGEEEGE